jgi:hypothetical protein
MRTRLHAWKKLAQARKQPKALDEERLCVIVTSNVISGNNFIEHKVKNQSIRWNGKSLEQLEGNNWKLRESVPVRSYEVK